MLATEFRKVDLPCPASILECKQAWQLSSGHGPHTLSLEWWLFLKGFCLFCVGATVSDVQGLLLTLCSGITSVNAQEAIWDAGDWTRVSCIQGEHPTTLYTPFLKFFSSIFRNTYTYLHRLQYYSMGQLKVEFIDLNHGNSSAKSIAGSVDSSWSMINCRNHKVWRDRHANRQTEIGWETGLNWR